MSSITVVKKGPGRSDHLTALIHMESYSDRVPRGSFVTLPERERYEFCGLDQMLLTMEDIMDASCVPEDRLRYRSLYQQPYLFRKEERSLAEPVPGGVAALSADKGALVIQILYRQHRSMQGKLFFSADQTQRDISFRSSLELIRMLHEYLSRKQKTLTERTGS